MATPACKPALRTVFSSAQREFYESLAAGGGARASTGAADEGAPPPAAAPEGRRPLRPSPPCRPAAGPAAPGARPAAEPPAKNARPKQGLARLMELAGSRARPLAGACALAVLSAAARLAPYFTIYLMVRAIILNWNDLGALDLPFLWGLAFATVGAAVLHGATGYLSMMLAHRAAFDVLYEVRLQLMDKLARIPSGYFNQVRQGEIKKVLNDDVEKIEGFIAHNLSDTVCAVALPLLTIAALAFVDWRLALLLVVPIVVSFLLLGSALGSPEGAACQRAMAQSREKLNGTTVEFVHGMPVVKVFNRSLAAFGRFEADAREFVGNIKWATWFNARGMGKLYAAAGTQMLLLLPAVLIILPTAASYADFLSTALLFFLVGGGMKEPVMQMITQALGVNGINASVARIDEVLAEPELSQPEHPVEPTAFDLAFEHVTFSYDGKKNAVEDVTFRVPAGSVVGLVGPSGGGKSTLAALGLRFFDPQEGRIALGGVDLRDIAPERLTELASSVFQDSFVLDDTVENNILMGSSAPHERVVAAAEAASIADVIDALPQGYRTVVGADGTRLSGGEAQRLAIARAMLRDTPLIILDEATAYADAENEAKIQDAFAQLAARKTVLVIAHRMKTVRTADLIVVVDEGRVVGTGTHDDLMDACPLYRSMVDADERKDAWTLTVGKEG
ncbi:ABC transporter ATP-binding protein [Eggerthella lenta]|uniref:ABC transporter ATP-binding protein n=1 Tax=Eggerthella lenta TaxID=84112 RepID=UPI001F256D01|nr:ABC transporter ATP-binding protein [Eggerthella lenta]